MSLCIENERVCLDVIIDHEDAFNAIRLLAESGRKIEYVDDVIKIPLDGDMELFIDTEKNNLRFLF